MPVTWEDIERLGLEEADVHAVLHLERRGDLTRMQALMEALVLVARSRGEYRKALEEQILNGPPPRYFVVPAPPVESSLAVPEEGK